MRDAIKSYRMIIKHKTGEESDTESEPLMSSVSSLSRSFGAITSDALIFKPDSESSELDAELRNNQNQTIPAKLPNFKSQLARRLLFPASYDAPEVNVIVDDENVYQNYHNYVKVTGAIADNSILASKSFTESSLNYTRFETSSHTHNSIVTIFAIWNTTMGSSLLAMSWGLEKSGLIPGIFITLSVAAISLYTAYIITKINREHGIGQINEMPELCGLLLGKWAEILAKIFSLIVLIGANIVYWILMSNFLYNSFLVINGYIAFTKSTSKVEVLCPTDNVVYHNESGIDAVMMFPTMSKIWNLYSTVPIFLAVLMFPLLNFKSATFFTKFNSLGTVSVVYVLIFVTVKAYLWGFNIPNFSMELPLKSTFCALSGMLSLSYFIHNIIISIMRNNQEQKNNGRDLTVAFILITFTYLFIGIVFYVSFPLAKRCIEDNILNNFEKFDTMSIVARLLLLFQLFTVFPLMCFMLRNDVMSSLASISKEETFRNISYSKVMVLNVIILSICILFACFFPKIGTLIRYTGALSGLVYIYLLPSLLMIASLKKDRNLTTIKFVFFSFIIVIGFVNLASQFFIVD